MKLKVPTIVEKEATTLRIQIPDRYDGEDFGENFPFHAHEQWLADIDIATGKVLNWPADAGARKLHTKVCDEGTYTLFDAAGEFVAKIENNYVPHSIVPGDYGDYVVLDIAADGTITNWKKPNAEDVSDAFFPAE